MTSSNGNIFRVTGPLCGEFTGPGEFPTQRPVILICVWINGWVNKREAGDLRCHRGHYDVIVMYADGWCSQESFHPLSKMITKPFELYIGSVLVKHRYDNKNAHLRMERQIK